MGEVSKSDSEQEADTSGVLPMLTVQSLGALRDVLRSFRAHDTSSHPSGGTTVADATSESAETGRPASENHEGR
jgi:hypothetical protein